MQNKLEIGQTIVELKLPNGLTHTGVVVEDGTTFIRAFNNVDKPYDTSPRAAEWLPKGDMKIVGRLKHRINVY